MRALILVVFFMALPLSLYAQSPSNSYEVLSVNASELIVQIAPKYRLDTVMTESGPAVRIRFAGGMTAGVVGSPGEMTLSLPILLPSAQAPSIEILSEHYETVTGLELAPIPILEKRNGILKERYIRNDALYHSASSQTPYVFAQAGTVRTAYSGSIEVYAVRYEQGTLRLIKEITLRIRFSNVDAADRIPSSASETELFRAAFVNGSITELHRSAVSAITGRKNAQQVGFKGLPTASGDEKWIAIKTTDEGIYRITSDQLVQYGISNPDPSTLALYGYGGKILPEAVDSLSGELAEVAIDVRSSGGSFSELRFYAPGTTDWRYSPESGTAKYHQLYHIKNPYSGSGHFLLKIGGAPAERRVVDKPDKLTGTPIVRETLPAMDLYENELKYEFPNYSREFVGETILRSSDLTLTLPQLPGYTPDSTYLRPATNSRATESHTFDFRVNNTFLGTVAGKTNTSEYYYSARNWDAEFALPSSAGIPVNMTVTVSTNEKQPQYWMNFVEIYYQRQARLSDGQLSFFLANDASAYRLSIANEPNAELWDVTDARNNIRLALSSGSSLIAEVQGPGKAMRRFFAFRESDLKSTELTSTNAPTLRSGLGQSGVELIIIVPEAYKDQGERLAEQRRRGGQATGPLSAAVVTVEDIYKEFGYGARDVSAIRDFLAYTFRHTAAEGETVPMYVALFGKGHTDYQNRTTELPVGVPVYETANFGSLTVYRSSHPEYVPDDAFFVRLMPRTNPKILDMAPGRIAVRNADEAEVFVDKVIKYETSSDIGGWRAKGVFIADDRYYEEGFRVTDPLPHLVDIENQIAQTDRRLTIERLYSHAYPSTIGSSGARFKPQLEAAVVDAFNSGSVLISFVGHGNPNVWTHESILKVPSTINKFSNLNRLAFLTTATCDFTTFDNYAELSGGVMLLLKPDGGIIGSLGTSRSVYAGEELTWEFYKKLFDIGCESLTSTLPVGIAYMAGRFGGASGNSEKFFILGDPSQRLLIPRQYIIIDSINGQRYDENESTPLTMKALSKVTVSGSVSSSCDGKESDPSFNGTVTITLQDAPTSITQTTTFTEQAPITDRWNIEGPILYRGTVTVKNGRFSARFVIPKDIKFDTLRARLQTLAYSNDFRAALGVATNIRIFGIDMAGVEDIEGPKLAVYIGNRRFRSGDIVPVHSKIIVDVEDASGLNTSTSSVGHSFSGWINNSTEGLIDLSQSYIARQDDYTTGTAERQTILPLGKNILNVRAFDALNNPSEGTVEFTARDGDPYELFDVALTSNPVRDGTTFTFLHPSSPQSPVDVTISIHTSDGRTVRIIEANGITFNEVRILWDVRDDAGVVVSDGAYVYRITVQDRLSGARASAGGVFIVQKP